MPNKVIMFIILFVVVGLLSLTTITMLSKIEAPNETDTPELYDEYTEQQEVVKPFLFGMNATTIFILLCLVFAGISLLLMAVRKFGRI